MHRRDFTSAQLMMMINMANIDKSSTLNISGIARAIGVSSANPQFRDILKYCFDNQIISEVDNIGSSKIIKIDYNALTDLIDEQWILTYIIDNYLSRWHFFTW